MAAYDLEEQEQLETLKAWWAARGNLVSTGALIIALGILGWRGWEWYQTRQSAEASGAYSVLQEAVEKDDVRRVKDAAGVIAEKYSGTAYADLSAMLAAAMQAEKGDKQNARAKLEWAAAKANDPLLRDLARLRLGAMLLEAREYDAALKQLEAKPADALLPRFADLRGDVLLAKGKQAEAKVAYKEAFDTVASLKGAENLKSVLELKLDALGGAQ